MTPEELNNEGIVQYRRGNYAKARALYSQAYRQDRSFVAPLANLAHVLGLQGHLEAAVSCLRRITALAPEDYNQWLALGNALLRLERYTECKGPLVHASRLRPEQPDIWHNLALVAYRQQDYDEAEILLNKVIELGHDDHHALFDLAHAKMAQGKLTEGLALYESRWHTLVHSPAWDFHIPEWRGEDLTDKRILVHLEQGYGDTIMCSRFLGALKGQVTFAVSPNLIRLFDEQNWGIDVINWGSLSDNANQIYDFHTPMFSMMRWMGIEPIDIVPEPYLTADPNSGYQIPRNGSFDVGICWASGDHGQKINWRRRVSDLKDWLQLAEVPDVRLWSLQKDESRNQIAELGAEALVGDVMDDMTDWLDTANFIKQLDLVISVDTAVVHLAGALGVPVWMISQYSPCWRWWDIDNGTGRPWYDDISIIQQKSPGDWKSALAEIKLDLKCICMSEMSLSELQEV